MLFKLSVNSIKKGLRDYAIYFFTLVIGVSIFYVFNAVGDQVALLDINKGSIEWISGLITDTISTVSVLTSISLGLLIVQSNRFIMKRRNKEFALYMILGMSKSKISIILLLETIIIGISSIALGIFIGIGLSQLMSTLIINLFEADISQYQFTISGTAIGKTILYFAIIYLVVMIFNNLIISRFKIINLIHSGKKSEKIKLKNPILCTIIFILSAIALAYAYYQVCWNTERLYLTTKLSYITTYIIIGAISTFFIFWSISGFIFRIMYAQKKKYYKGLNSFTFRQISSKINTMVSSMTVICLTLFVTICTISSGFALRDSLNEYYSDSNPADYFLMIQSDKSKLNNTKINIVDKMKENGFDITKYFKNYISINTYRFEPNNDFFYTQHPYECIKLSDYNKLMDFYGREHLSLNDNEFAMLYTTKFDKNELDKELQSNKEITINNHKLISRYNECKYGKPQSLDLANYVVPDNVIDDSLKNIFYFIGNYDDNCKDEPSFDDISKSLQTISTSTATLHTDPNNILITKTIATLLCLYIGFVFLIYCGTSLALKELSDIADSYERYKILRKIGADEKDISKSIFRQIRFFFLMPLFMACIHSIFGIKFALNLIQIVSFPNLISSVLLNSVIIILIYGGYFLITYRCCKSIIKVKK